jgi:hypothetical protein
MRGCREIGRGGQYENVCKMPLSARNVKHCNVNEQGLRKHTILKFETELVRPWPPVAPGVSNGRGSRNSMKF